MENYFTGLYAVDVSEKVRKKNNLSYLPWAAAWAEVKKSHPDATYNVYEREDGRFWWDDGKSAWVKASVMVNEIEHIERLPIMDMRNKAIPAEEVLSTDANKAVQRALAKACGRHGIGLYIYEGEDLPEEARRERKQKTAEEAAAKAMLDAAHKAIVDLCKKLIDKGIDKQKIYDLIAENNAGKNNPNSIPTVELCEEITKKLNKLTKESK